MTSEVFQKLFETESPADDHPLTTIKTPTRATWYPVGDDELAAAVKMLPDKAAGPDSFTVADLKSMDQPILSVLLNLILGLGDIPPCWKINRTILIPKGTTDLDHATNWRPVTISSVFVRLLHRILAHRISAAVNLNPLQRAFIPVGGCFENTIAVDFLIRHARKNRREFHLVGIDVSKAFDSVSHNSIQRALRRQGIEEDMIRYIMASYKGTSTTIQCNNVEIDNVNILRGVKQGDPMSPVIFNSIIDELLDSLPRELGYPFSATDSVNSLGFADDLNLIAHTVTTMKRLINITESFFSHRSMKINSQKCFNLSLIPSTHDRVMTTSFRTTFSINDFAIQTCSYSNCLKYLGIYFDPSGKIGACGDHLKTMLGKITSAPLKPHQKVFLATTFAIPKMMHQLILGRITKGLLSQFDLIIRHFIKSTLHLPVDTPNAFLYTKTNFGGLGIIDLSTSIPSVYEATSYDAGVHRPIQYRHNHLTSNPIQY